MPDASHRVIPGAAEIPSGPMAASRGIPASSGTTKSFVVSLPARAAGGLVWLYQKAVSPALAAANPTCGCRFAPTCSHYAREAFHTHGLRAGLFLTVRRLVKCGPWHSGGLDPVPPRRAPACVRVSLSALPPAHPRAQPTIIHG